MSLPDPASGLTAAHQQLLLDLAEDTISKGLAGEMPSVRSDDFAQALQAPRATFVTLNIDARLRGCIGTLEARQALVLDVSGNAFNAAFRDPRFAPLGRMEFARLHIHIAVLSPPEPVRYSSPDDLLGQLRPRVDGLILEQGSARATFLPSVWDQLPDPHDFLRHLKLKAGLPADDWSEHIRVQRYTAQSWGRHAGTHSLR